MQNENTVLLMAGYEAEVAETIDWIIEIAGILAQSPCYREQLRESLKEVLQ